MYFINRIMALFLISLLLATTPFSVHADPQDQLGYQEARRLMEAGIILPLQAIIPKVKGRILEVELEYERGLYLYEIEVLNAKGLVVELEFDATTGEILELRIEE